MYKSQLQGRGWGSGQGHARVMVIFRIRDRLRVRSVTETGRYNRVLCVRMRCGRKRSSSGIWAVARREGVQHGDAALDVATSGLNLGPKTQTIRVRVRVRVSVRRQSSSLSCS